MSDEHFKLSNPAPLGLLGFGLTTVLLNLVNAGAFPLDTMILAMGIAYGGIAQIIVGAMEYRKGNTFGTVAFTSYGLFWWSFVMLLLLPKFTGFAAPSAASLSAYFIMWGIFTFAMFFGTLKANRALQLVFATLAILFFMLADSSIRKQRYVYKNHWRRRHHMRLKRGLSWSSRGPERIAPKNYPANFPNCLKKPNSFFVLQKNN